MSANINRAPVLISLRDVHGQPFTDTVEVTFYNKIAHSLSQRFEVKFKGKEVSLAGVAAFPTGLSEVFIKPKRYRSKSIFMTVHTGAKNVIDEIFFLDPAQARPTLMDFNDLPAKSYGVDLIRILAKSKIGKTTWDSFDKRNRATILNLCAKMAKETTKNGQPLIRQVESIETAWLDKKHQERMYSRVNASLLGALRKYPERFDGVSGQLHKFPVGWTPTMGQNSFKSRDKAGNIQLTFADGTAGAQLADIDLDDHAGVAHAADVLRHKITGNNTDPYNMHQILVYFQQLDPGYKLS